MWDEIVWENHLQVATHKLEEVKVCWFVELKLGGEAILDSMKKSKGAWVFGLQELEELVYLISWIDKIKSLPKKKKKVCKIVSFSKVLMICECVFGFWDLWEVFLAMQCFESFDVALK